MDARSGCERQAGEGNFCLREQKFTICFRSVYKELHADRETGC